MSPSVQALWIGRRKIRRSQKPGVTTEEQGQGLDGDGQAGLGPGSAVGPERSLGVTASAPVPGHGKEGGVRGLWVYLVLPGMGIGPGDCSREAAAGDTTSCQAWHWAHLGMWLSGNQVHAGAAPPVPTAGSQAVPLPCAKGPTSWRSC